MVSAVEDKQINFSGEHHLAWVSGVTKAFGQVVAVSNVSFGIPRGSILGFLGPNGSGKTTSIRMLLGLIRPQLGEVRIFGEDPFTHSAIKRNLGYVAESSAFPPWIRAREYLFKLGRLTLVREEAKRRADEVLAQVQLEDVGNKKIVQFSKGMKQRMKLAQALLHHPLLVIADEPFNGLDPVVRKRVFDLLHEYRDTYGTTFFVSSHILFEVDRLADQIVLLYKGRTIAQGAPLRIRSLLQEQPHSIRIATPSTKQLASLLIANLEGKTFSSIEFNKDPRNQEPQMIVTTHDPLRFYHLLTELIADNDISVKEIRQTDEGLESLFQALTQG